MAGVRRHLDRLSEEGLVERHTAADNGARRGRPPAGWRLTPAGHELFPRRYDVLALNVLEDLAEQGGPEAVEGVFARRSDKAAETYRTALDGVADLTERVQRIAALRDGDGYQAECVPGDDGDVLLVQHNCAVHRVAERHGILCEMELALFRQALGPGVDVTRTSHAMAGDATCCYRVRWRSSPS
jgi:predicted ArsR family transcriptional regulator